MGITCKPVGKFESMIKKMENEKARVKAERLASKPVRKSDKKS